MKTKLIIVFLILISVCGCQEPKEYEFKEDGSKIKSIELVDAENCREYTVVETLPTEEIPNFMEDFSKVGFYTYNIFEPMKIMGHTIKVTYEDDSFEMINYYWSEYIHDDKRTYVKRHCNDQDFQELIDKYFNITEPSSEYQDDIHIATP